MAPNKSPAQVMAEQRARRSISDSAAPEKRVKRQAPAVGGTFLHRGDEELAETIIKRQQADEEEAARLRDATVTEVVDEVTPHGG